MRHATIFFVLLLFFSCTAALAVFCPRCGVENAESNKFCRNCGLPITEVAKYVGFLEGREKEMMKLMSTNQPIPADAGEGAVGLMPKVEKDTAVPSPASQAREEKIPRARDLLKAGFESMKPTGEGGIVIMMTYSAKGGARPFTLPGKVYLNSTYLGEIQVVEEEKRDDYGFRSDLFGKMASYSDEVHYKFVKAGIPAGKYQVKIIMQQKGFLRNVSRYKVFPDVAVNPGEEAKLFYSWNEKTPFGN